MEIDMGAKTKDTASPEQAGAQPAVVTRLRTDGANTSAELAAVAAAANAPENAEIGRLTAEVERLNRMVSSQDGLIQQKNAEIARLEEQKAALQRQVGQLTVAAVQNPVAQVKGLTVVEYEDARKKGTVGFVVLREWTGGPNRVHFTLSQGVDARQYPRLKDYVAAGLQIAAMPEGAVV